MSFSRVDKALSVHKKGQEPPSGLKFERPDMPLTAEMVEAFLLVYLKDRLDSPVDTPQFHRELWAMCCSPEKYIAIAAPRGHAKCLHEDTLVSMADGTRLPIKDIEVGDQLLSLDDGYGQFSIDKVSKKWNSGTKPIIALKTRSGHELKLTAEHKVLTFDGWKEAGQLTLDDRIASPRQLPSFFNGEMSDEEVKFIAYLIAEGGLTGGSVTFTNTDKPVVDDFTHCANALGFEVVPQSRKNPKNISWRAKGAIPWVKRMGLWGKYSTDKRVPEIIFMLDDRLKWLFIEALMVTDGWFAVEAGSGGITLANEALIDDIRHIFTQLNVVTSKIKRPNACAGAWALTIGNEGVRKILRHCDLKQKRKAAETICKKQGYSLTDVYPNRIKKFYRNVEREFRDKGIARVDNQYDITHAKLNRMIAYKPVKEWVMYRDAVVYWDKVVSIADAGEAQTYDVEVEGNHNLVTNGLVTHNSTAVTLAYALVMLLFRQRDFVIIVSDTWGQSVEFLRDLKAELLENDGIIKDFETKKALKDSEDDVIFQMRDGYKFRVVARGSEQKVRGLKWNNKRPNLIIGDDLEGDEQVESKNRRDKFFKWMMKALLPCGADDCLFRLVGTILHFDSALERIMKDPTWTTKRYTAHKSFNDFSEILWPEKFNEQRLRDIREKYVFQGEADGYSCEYLNNPIAEGDAYFRREDMVPMSDEVRKNIREGRLALVYYAGWDYAVSKDQRSDYTVGNVWGVGSDNTKYKIDCRRGRWDAKEIIDEMFSVQQAFSPACHFVEGGTINNSLGPFLYTEMATRGKYLNLVKINSTKDKQTRSRPLQAMTKSRHLVYDRQMSNWDEQEEEYNRFPKGQHDDIVDADAIIAQGLQDIIPALTDEEIEDEEWQREYAPQTDQGRCESTGY